MMLYLREGDKVVRYMGKDFHVGDKLYLREWNKDAGYTSREIKVVITSLIGEFTDGICLISVDFVEYKDNRPFWKRFIDWLHFVKEKILQFVLYLWILPVRKT